jgi:tRNA-binding EMAP/Myf-like protein
MAIIAVRVTEARDHENAERLRVYNVIAPGVEPTQIIANKSNIYEVGDVVAGAMIGTVLSDGTAIAKNKIRGVLSFGMLLGKVEVEPGTDLTEAYQARHEAVEVDESNGVVEESNWTRFTSIESYHRVRGEILALGEVIVAEKVHGWNFRIGYTESRPYIIGTHTARIVDSRMSPDTWPKGSQGHVVLTWAAKNGMKDRIAEFRANNPEINNFALFGEVVGPGVTDLHYGLTEPRVVFFNGQVAVNGRYLDYDKAREIQDELLDTADLLGILYRGQPFESVFKRHRDEPSRFAATNGVEGQISEGVVILPAKESISPSQLNRLVAKYRSPLYEERKSLRRADTNTLPVYLSAYDLLSDFIVAERVRHVFRKVESFGGAILPQNSRLLAERLFDDIMKESEGERPEDWRTLDRNTLVTWTLKIAKPLFDEIIPTWK